MMELVSRLQEDSVPPAVGARATVSRLWNAALGGKDNFADDRELLEDLRRTASTVESTAREIHDWVMRSVEYLAGSARVNQFVHCGFGLPMPQNAHDLMHRVNPESTMIYVDLDPEAVAYGQALLADDDRIFCLRADPLEPAALLSDPDLLRHLELDRPVAVLHVSTLHHDEDDDRVSRATRTYVDLLPSGSYLSMAHFYDPADGSEGNRLARVFEEQFRAGLGACKFRQYEAILSFFDGLELLAPGVVPLFQWWPRGPLTQPAAATDHLIIGGVGRKP